MAKNTTYFFLFLFVIIFSFSSKGQTVTWNTVTQGTGVNYGNNGSGGITFVVENTAGFPAVLQEVSNYFTSTGTSNVELWYSSTSLSGLPGTINATNGWTQIATGVVAINNNSPLNAAVGTLNTLFSGLNFTIPAGTTYRFHISSSVTVEYTGTTTPTGAVPLTFSQQGVNLQIGEYQIGGQNVGIGGNTTGAVNNPRAFTGQIVLNLLSTPCSGQPTAGTTTASTTTPCPGMPINFSLVGASQASGLSYSMDTCQ